MNSHDAIRQLRSDMENRGRLEREERNKLSQRLARLEQPKVIAPADYPGGEVKELDIDRVWLAVQAAPDFPKQAAVGAMKRLFPERIR